jgi:Mn-dependent DtxR family transcriptional regulator
VLTLTDAGRDAARALVRTHRLWELYLVEHLGHRADHVHRTAMDLEHHTGPEARAALEATAEGGEARPGVDPHGRPIPPRG